MTDDVKKNHYGITIDEYQKRRFSLSQQMGENAVAVLFAAPAKVRSQDVEYPYRPDNNFLYLSGFCEPDAVLVVLSGSQTQKPETVLFCQNKNPEKEQWEGVRCGPQKGVSAYAMDAAYSIEELADRLPELLAGRDKLFYDFALGRFQTENDERLFECLRVVKSKARAGYQSPEIFCSLATIVEAMRLRKSEAELALMSKAASISAHAHCQAMLQAAYHFNQSPQTPLYEYQLAATLHYHFESSGAAGWAYPSIVGGGDNACILHYTQNHSPLNPQQLVLIDAGAEFCWYAADITRTFPVGGRFSPAQKALYNIVLDAQLAAIAAVKPGACWSAPHEAAVEVLVTGLVALGLLQGNVPDLISEKAYRKFYMHNTGHWLGMDVHDVGRYKVRCSQSSQASDNTAQLNWRPLEVGMVLTIEPGLYISAADQEVDPKWRGIGIRIEDDVVVTEQGYKVLTAEVPKTVADIEALMSQQ